MKHIVIICVIFVGSFAEDWIIYGEYEYKIFGEKWIAGENFQYFQELCGAYDGEVAVLKDENVANLVGNSATSMFSQYKINYIYSICSLLKMHNLTVFNTKKSILLNTETQKKVFCLTQKHKKRFKIYFYSCS